VPVHIRQLTPLAFLERSADVFADRVAVVDAGRITEIGPHDELVAAGGDYAALWHSWQHE